MIHTKFAGQLEDETASLPAREGAAPAAPSPTHDPSEDEEPSE
jgi:hypothetical protein